MTIPAVGIMSAGTVRNGIAQACAVAGVKVVMVDIAQAAVDKGLATVSGSLDRLIKQEKLTADTVRDYLAHVTQGKVSRYSLPGFNAFNFTLENALGGGGVASLRYDPQGKALAQIPNEQNTEALASNAAGKQTPRRMRRAAEIITAARDTFLEKGFERASVSEIATKVGVVEGLLYSYFPTKRDLLNEVLRGMYEPLIREMEDGFSRLQGLRSRMRFLVWRHLRVYVEDP
eukprot:gene59120-78882_t